MKWVSLEEAARQLGISKGAAYKRAQRGTLAKKKGADGRLYIYLDDKRSENTATDARKPSVPNVGEPDTEGSEDTSTGAKKPGVPNEGNVVSLTTLANASAIFAAIGVGIYVLGMLSLLMPIRRVFTHDWSAAWYAVAILPKTVAAGQGVGLLAVTLFFYALGLGLFTSIVFAFRYRHWLPISWPGLKVPLPKRGKQLVESLDRSHQIKKYRRPLFGSAFILVISVMTVGTFFLLHILPMRTTIKTWEWEWGPVLVTMLFYVTCYLGFEVMAAAFERRSDKFLPGLRKRRLFWRGAAIIIASAFIIAGFAAARADPHLPIVEITKKTDANNGKRVLLDGSLLAHSDGFWYLFEDEGKKRGI
jgi:hypothetical protein